MYSMGHFEDAKVLIDLSLAQAKGFKSWYSLA